MDMNIDMLEYFKKVAEVKSISKVSQQSHLSQSALSQIIHKMEEHIGYELFTRSNKGVELNKMGKVVYDYADLIIKTYQKMINELDSMSHNQQNVLINCTWSIANYSLPCLLLELKNKYPNIQYELHSNRCEEIIDNVENGLVDFGIIYGEPTQKNITITPFGEDQIVLVCNNKLNIPDKLTIEDLKTRKLIHFKQGCYYKTVKSQIEQLLIQPDEYEFTPILSLDSISAVKNAVTEGCGFLAFLPQSSVKKEIKEGKLKEIKINGFELSLKVNIISLPSNQLTKEVQHMIDLFIKLGTKVLC